ncbi:hypothetical protein MPH_06393 [Macrophomina phaseolina MS6]|uniref:Fe2OG dioxygenase domain-containing protein n=1 Tax=Macrophomina phaseolina (strain MS6) TaxID=1126212 RepID=K2S1P3_MACPH|nr:hypothetical protein MPH_06393 [Macrophomina phaseolina MS6]
MGSSESPVPIVDFGPFYTGDDAVKKAVAERLDEALHTVGFVYLKNHGVPQEKVDKAFEWGQSKRFFALPTDVKMLAPHPPGGSHHRGYSGLGIEKVSQHVFDEEALTALREVPDVKESYETGNTTDERQPNIWLPDDALPGFRAYMEAFFEDCAAMTHTLLRVLALSLSLPSAEYLSAAHSTSPFQLRLLHYPPVPVRALTTHRTHSRIGAHSDFGSLTLLFQDDVGGLEVEDPCAPGTFRAAPPVPGTLLVNVGDLMERWSNGRWRSTVHRVGAPPAGEHGEEEAMCRARYSIPFFSAPNDDAVIEALPGCWDDKSNPKKYEAVTAEQYGMLGCPDSSG